MKRKIVYILMFIFLLVLIPLFLFIFDLNNWKVINVPGIFKINLDSITRDYDWLCYIGSITSAIGTITLGIITLLQNNRLNEINKRLEEDKMISDHVISIDFEQRQDMYMREDSVGFKLFEKDVNLENQLKLNESQEKVRGSGKHDNVRFLINIKYNGNKIINSFYIENLKIEYQNQNELDTARYFSPAVDSEYYTIEKKEDNLYYLTLILYGLNDDIIFFEQSERIRLTFTYRIKDYIDFETTIWSEIVLDDAKKDKDGDKIIYSIFKKRMSTLNVKRAK